MCQLLHIILGWSKWVYFLVDIFLDMFVVKAPPYFMLQVMCCVLEDHVNNYCSTGSGKILVSCLMPCVWCFGICCFSRLFQCFQEQFRFYLETQGTRISFSLPCWHYLHSQQMQIMVRVYTKQLLLFCCGDQPLHVMSLHSSYVYSIFLSKPLRRIVLYHKFVCNYFPVRKCTNLIMILLVLQGGQQQRTMPPAL